MVAFNKPELPNFGAIPQIKSRGWLGAFPVKVLRAVSTWLPYCSRLHKQVSKLEAQGRVKAWGKSDQRVLSLGSDCTAV